MVQTSTLDKEEIDAMLERINSVPITETLKMQILRLDKGECEALIPRDTMWDGIFETFHGGILATIADSITCLLYTSPSPRDKHRSRMPSSA